MSAKLVEPANVPALDNATEAEDDRMRDIARRERVHDGVVAFARRCNFDEHRSLHKERLALILFDESARLGLHHMDRVAPDTDQSLAPREILSCAALLHDVGRAEEQEHRHKAAFNLVVGEKIPHISKHDRSLVALVVRYHRGSGPEAEKYSVIAAAHAALSPSEQRMVVRLSAILSLAGGLASGQVDAIQDLHLILKGNRVTVRLAPGMHDDAARIAGQKTARRFENQFKVRVELG